MVLRRLERYGLVVALLAFMLLSLAAPAGAVTYSPEPSIPTTLLQPTDIAYLPSAPGFVVLDSQRNQAFNIWMTGAIRSGSPVLMNTRIAYNSHDGNIYQSGTGPGGDELDIFDTNFVPQYTTPYSIAAPPALGAYYDPGIDTDVAVLGYFGMVQKISTNTGAVVGSFSGPVNPVAIACAPDITTSSAMLAYILTSSEISIYDLSTGSYRATPISGISSGKAIAVESSGPHHLLFVGDGTQVKIFSPSPSVQDQYSPAGTITLPANVRGIAVDDSEKLYVTTQGSSTIAVYSLRPGITGIDPHSGPTAGGTVVTITGQGFQNADSSDLTVYFGSTPASGIVVDSDTRIYATAPAGTAGTVDITVDSPYGTSWLSGASAYTYVAPPTVTSVSPASGPTDGGTSVTITGTGFMSGATVTCGGSPATGVNVVSATTITATTPAHAAGSVDVVVTSPGGASATSPADQFTYITPCSPAVALTAGGSLAAAVSSVCDGGTITVGPGTYRDYGIAVGKSVTIRAADGSGPADITIDGMQGGSSILAIAAGHTVVLDNLTFFNATGTDGGAVNNNGNLVVNTSAFRNCTAADGGAISNTGTIGGITSSDFFNNTVVSSGGGSHGGSAIWSSGTITGITASTFRDGTAIGSGLYGAAIYNTGSIGTVSSTTFSGGRTDGGGGAIYNAGSIDTLSSSTFSENQAQVGGAILNGGTISTLSGSTFSNGLALVGGAIANGGLITTISGTTFSGCRADSAGAGGAIYNTGTIGGISLSTFTNCECGYNGGAIDNLGGTIGGIASTAFAGCQGRDGGAIWNSGSLDLASDAFTGCAATNGGAIFNAVTMSDFGRMSILSTSFAGNTALSGGAIYDEGGITGISSSSFTDNTATSGGALWVNGGDAFIDSIAFSRFRGNTASTGPAVGISPGMGRIDTAVNNWWGTNSGPAGFTSGVSATSPWLVLNASATPSSITILQTSTVMMKMTNNSAGDDTIVMGNVPDGIPVAYSLGGVTGSLAPEQGNVTIGTNSTVFDPSSAGTATIAVTVDGESVAVPVEVTRGACRNTVTIGGTDSIADGIADTCDGGTLILNPGTYSQQDITIGKNITIRANTSYGGTAADTIIDAEGSGRIFLVPAPFLTVILDSLSLQNGYIVVPMGHTLGGAVVNQGTLTVNSSVFSNCTVGGTGGAIANAGTLTVTSSTFTDCTATGVSPGGGAIANTILNGPSTATVSSSSFVDCTSELSGGAIVNGNGCTLDISSSTFTGCTASTYGGAIQSIDYSHNTITSSTFSGCTAASGGGAIAVSGSHASLSVLSSDFDGCGAGSDGGGAVLAFPETNIHFSRFYGNTATGSGTAVRFVSPSGDATSNWWGTNSGPGAAYFGNPAGVATWLVLGATANPASLTTAQTSAIRFNLTSDSDGIHHDPTGGHVPDDIPGSWAIVTGSGTLSPDTGTTADGANTTRFTPAGTGATNISATVDDQTVYLGVDVSAVPTTVPTTVPATTTTTGVYAPVPSGNDDGFPAVAPTATQAGNLPLMTVTVNIGGDSKAWQAVVTGTGLKDLIVTGTVQNGAGGNLTAPPGIVFQYISLEPARYTSITKAVIHFAVPQAWLDENHIDPKSIVLYHSTPNGWVALPTTVVFTKDGTVYFSAESPGFSLFAIAGMPAVPAAPVTAAATQEIAGTPVPEQASTPPVTTQAPVTTQTTALLATTPKASSPSLLVTVILVIAAIGMSVAGGYRVRHRKD